MADVWKAIPGAPGYDVSTAGQIRSRRRSGAPRILTGGMGTHGYRQVVVGYAGKRRAIMHHRAVLLAFVGPCPEGMEARHLNGDRLDNRLGNLAWGTRQQNHDDKRDHGTTARGEGHGCAKLGEPEALAILWYGSQGGNRRALAARFGVTPVMVDNIRAGRNWSHLSAPQGEQELPKRLRGLKFPAPPRKRAARAQRDAGIALERGAVAAILWYGQTYASTWLAPSFGVTATTVQSIVRRSTWAHVPMPESEAALEPRYRGMSFSAPAEQASARTLAKREAARKRARAIKTDLASGMKQVAIASKHGVSQGLVSQIRSGKAWADA